MNNNMPSDGLPNEQGTSLDGHISNDATTLMREIMEQVAKMKREMISRRIKYGKAAKKAQREQQHEKRAIL